MTKFNGSTQVDRQEDLGFGSFSLVVFPQDDKSAIERVRKMSFKERIELLRGKPEDKYID